MKHLLCILAITTSCLVKPILSRAITAEVAAPQGSEATDALLTNLGAYLGYDLTTVLSDEPYSALLDISATKLSQRSALMTLLGAIPVNAISEAFSAFVPTNSSYSSLNSLSNYTFESPTAYNTTSSNSGSVTVNVLIDQPTYQNDPVSQATLNILTTPDYSYCMNNDLTAWVNDCNYLYNTSVNKNVIGSVPDYLKAFTYSYNQSVLPQLNGNTLVGPLLYTTQQTQTSGGSNEQQVDTTKGLTANNQIQEAANFIRYVSRGVNPINLPTVQAYQQAYTTATSTDPTTSINDKNNAQANITSYLSDLRTYAAENSVALSNLYAILARRMPQQKSQDSSSQSTDQSSSSPTSQALSEFQMATRRLYSPNNQQEQWIDKINNASSATVQKEIAVLLAEINYQLYLNRQQEERQLLTSSIMLLQALQSGTPKFENSSNGSSPSSG
jgi:intracellular multiplication protein IcmX